MVPPTIAGCGRQIQFRGTFMTVFEVDTLVVGGGQAGLAMSAHLGRAGVDHVVLERDRIAQSWRTRRWDSLVANGPAWHDRFPDLDFAAFDPDSFVPKDGIAAYLETFAGQIEAPVREGVAVTAVRQDAGGADHAGRFTVETTQGTYRASNVVLATGPFQVPSIPPIVPADAGVVQIHSNDYRNPGQLPDGAVLVVGAGSSGVQIADELARADRRVFLSVGPHSRPPRRYRGKDFCWWLGALGHWNATEVVPGKEHVTIAVSGAHGGHTVDFRELAERGIVLLGRTESHADGVVHFATDLAANIAAGDADYLSVLDQADAHIAAHSLDFPEEPEARTMRPDPACVSNPILSLDLAGQGVTSIVWATGFGFDYDWVATREAFDARGHPVHAQGVSPVPGLYFVGLPWLSRRASAFIWGVWHDAERLAGHIAARIPPQPANAVQPA